MHEIAYLLSVQYSIISYPETRHFLDIFLLDIFLLFALTVGTAQVFADCLHVQAGQIMQNSHIL